MISFIFIDSVGNGRETAYLLKANQIKVLNIKTSIKVSGERTNSDVFDEEIYFNGCISSLIERLSQEKILGIYTPIDCNHQLKYQLIQHFFPERINYQGSTNPSEKDLLQVFIKDCGLPFLPCVEVDHRELFLSFIKQFPKFIVKPKLSTGSINTKIYTSSNYYSEFQGTKGGYFYNSPFIAQPYLVGKEYTCSFSWYTLANGIRIKIRNIVHLEKIQVGGIPVPQTSTLIDHKNPIVRRIESHLHKICPFLPMKFGSASFGFILEVSTDILYVIDFNDRLSNLSGSSLGTFLSTGGTQMLDFLYLHITPEEFCYQANRPYFTNYHMCILYLLVKKEGFLDCCIEKIKEFEEKLKKLASYQTHHLEIFKPNGTKYVYKTTCQREQIARVTLCNTDATILREDIKKIRDIEVILNQSITLEV